MYDVRIAFFVFFRYNSFSESIMMSEWVRFSAFTVLGLCIGIIDFRSQRIPNVLLLVLLSSLVTTDVLMMAGENIVRNALAGLGGFGLFYAVYRLRGGIGFGDVKYAGVIGYFLGPELVLIGLLCGVLFGILYWCIGCLFFRWGKEKRFPFGPWLSCGAVATVLFYWSLI